MNLLDYWRKFHKQICLAEKVLYKQPATKEQLKMMPDVLENDIAYYNMGFNMCGDKLSKIIKNQLTDLKISTEIMIDILSSNNLRDTKQLYRYIEL